LILRGNLDFVRVIIKSVSLAVCLEWTHSFVNLWTPRFRSSCATQALCLQ